MTGGGGGGTHIVQIGGDWRSMEGISSRVGVQLKNHWWIVVDCCCRHTNEQLLSETL